MNYDQLALELHEKYGGKIALRLRDSSELTREKLSAYYTPGVAAVSREVAAHPEKMGAYCWTNNLVAVISDGSAVLGLGDIGPRGAMPVMEGKALLFKHFAGIDAVPIVLDIHEPDEIIAAVKAIAPSFGAINLEDINAPKCFEVEERLKAELDIPLMHDDQHGTAVVVLAGLINSMEILAGKASDFPLAGEASPAPSPRDKSRATSAPSPEGLSPSNSPTARSEFASEKLNNMRAVFSGVGAAGVAIMKLLKKFAPELTIYAVDSRGIISANRDDLNPIKQRLLDENIIAGDRDGQMADAVKSADIFVGVSMPGVLTAEMIKTMNANPIIFALANPTPEIMPDAAKSAGAAIVATGRSDFPNQVNNALAFPGIFRGALDNGVKKITDDHKIAAAKAIAGLVATPSRDEIIPSVFVSNLADTVAKVIM